jgi:ATP-dependent Clp protease ATP-binding subunit ClpA
MVHPEDVALLVGAPPGYVGYSDSLPLHALAQIPWCVVRFENADLCHPSIRAVVNQALQEGRLTDGRGKPIYFSDAVVLLTANITWQTQRSLGFQLNQEEGAAATDVLKAVSESIGAELAGQVDLFLPGLRPVEVSKEWLKDTMLADLAERFLKQGLQLEWDASLLDWMVQAHHQFQSGHDWERWVDYSLSPAIVNYLPKPGGPKVVAMKVKIEQEKIKVETS